jgi:crotonobetainyl-CoA:carnitine CoA-transferase CaiB-like acyl-CoA transferase
VLDGLIAAIFGRHDRAALAERLAAAGIAFGNLNSVADFARHPQLRRVEIATPSGPVSVPSPPARASNSAPFGAVPALGAHSAALRREFGL